MQTKGSAVVHVAEGAGQASLFCMCALFMWNAVKTVATGDPFRFFSGRIILFVAF